MNDGQELLGRAERLVQLALNRGADEAECYYEKGAGVEVELEAGRIANTSASQGLGAGLRILKGGRLGFAYLTRDEQAPTAIALALRQARLAPKKNFHLPASTKAKPIARRWDERVAALDVQDAIALADGLLAGAKEGCPKATVSGGGASLSSAWLAIASSAGVAVWDRQTSNGCSVSLTLAEGERSISAGETDSRHRFDLDPHAVAMEATSTVNALRKPKPAGKSGTFQILLRPESAAELVTNFVVSAATGDEARRGKTVWSDKLGEPVAAKILHVADDSHAKGAVGGVPFDGEGVATTRLPLLDGGVLRNFIYDSWDAHRFKAKSTASACRSGFKSRPEAGTHHLVVESPKARPMDTLVASVTDGFLVQSVLGAHTANPTTGDFSVTAPNVWRIRKGAVVGPVSDIAIGGSLPELLTKLEGVSTEAKQMDGGRVPALLFGGVSVSI